MDEKSFTHFVTSYIKFENPGWKSLVESRSAACRQCDGIAKDFADCINIFDLPTTTKIVQIFRKNKVKKCDMWEKYGFPVGKRIFDRAAREV